MENTIPVQLGDGTVGSYDPVTNTVYNADGTINVPAALQPFLGMKRFELV